MQAHVACAEAAIKAVVTKLRLLKSSRTGVEWAELLSTVEFAINSARSSRTGMSPFELMFGFNPRAPTALIDKRAASTVAEAQSRTMALSRAAVDYLVDYYADLRSAHDAGRLAVSYKPGDSVYVHPSALRTAASALTAGVPPKLQSVYSGPFPVTAATDAHGSTRVQLPAGSRAHPWIHNKWLKPAPRAMSARQPAPSVEVPEAIIDRRVRPSGVEFLVRYKDLSPDHARWLPLDAVPSPLIADFQAKFHGAWLDPSDDVLLARLQHAAPPADPRSAA